MLTLAVAAGAAGVCARLFADEPYARSRDYDLQHSKMALKFDLEQKKVMGEVTHSLAILREGTPQVAFDSVGLTIESVTVNKAPAKFETTAEKLLVALPAAAHAGDKFDVDIRYEGKPAKGLYFILPDKEYPNRPKQIWSQGESEDTRYYLPTYDYPNDRLTTETILTVPASWVTVANGKLINVSKAAEGMKTWTWRESVPSSTYLITVVAGEFDEVKQSWHGLPVTYYAPKGRGDRLLPNYERTPEMMEVFSKKLGVEYPWEKYAQVMVDDFVAGGMENSSATTNTSSSLRSPKLLPEFPGDEDPLISHELAHQWFGDLVTCNDWGDIWLNEGFATFFEMVWTESHYPKEQADYERWNMVQEWLGQPSLYAKPIVRHDFDDSSEFDGNAYGKGGLVLYMLRRQIGETEFYNGLRHYLEVHRGKNVVTADLIQAIEEANHIDVQQFFDQWIYGAGAPKFDVSYGYDEGKHQVALIVKQTQRVEGRVGIFHVPVDVEITTASGAKARRIMVSKETETFLLPANGAPLMVLFDKGGQVLKATEFHKEKKEWLYQLKNSSEFADRGEAAQALAKMKNDDEAVTALGAALDTDKAWGVREIAADALGRIGNATAGKQLLNALDTNELPYVRSHIVAALGNIKEEPKIAEKVAAIARGDASFRARASALQALGKLKAADAFPILSAAVDADSPDDFLRNSALRALGFLGEDKAVPLLREWAAPGKAIGTREAAIASLGRLQKSNKEITTQVAGYLKESHYPIRYAAIFALGSRGDASAIPALQALLKSDDLSIEMAPTVKQQIARLQKTESGKGAGREEGDTEKGEEGDGVAQRLDRLEHLIQEMNDRLKSIESHLSKK
ncbi:MAG TPA: M1 family aminopeptidase [Candidatus Acidoferrum sp.]|nr:M1 family aminopeptidase [Candidatus Acidoferrum sp.]